MSSAGNVTKSYAVNTYFRAPNKLFIKQGFNTFYFFSIGTVSALFKVFFFQQNFTLFYKKMFWVFIRSASPRNLMRTQNLGFSAEIFKI